MLLLDEVLAGLVPAERAPVMELLENLRENEGTTLVFVEHIMAAVMRLSDSVLVLDMGRVLTSGPCGRGRARPARDRGLPGRGADQC